MFEASSRRVTVPPGPDPPPLTAARARAAGAGQARGGGGGRTLRMRLSARAAVGGAMQTSRRAAALLKGCRPGHARGLRRLAQPSYWIPAAFRRAETEVCVDLCVHFR